MTSRIISFLRMFPRITGSVQSSHPNSWALMDVWRRLFEPKDDWSEQKQIMSMENVDLGSSMNNKKPTEPILSDVAIAERRQFLRDNFKDKRHPWLITRATSSVQNYHPSLQHDSLERENQILHQPNLDIPVGNSYMTLAQ